MKKDKDKEALIEQLKMTPIVQTACTKTGIGRATFYRWKKDDKMFAKQADDALEAGLALITDMAESQLINAIKNENLPAILFWLKHHHKAYTTKIEVDAQHSLKQPILTNEQKKIINKALRLVIGERKGKNNGKSKN